MEMEITLPGGAHVDAHFGKFTVRTDQPEHAGGEDTAPSPFSLFLASIGACAGYYVSSFCGQRGIPTDGIRIIQRSRANRETGMVQQIDIEIQLPPDFPEKYRASVIKSAELCAVKKHLEAPPMISVFTREAQTIAA
jgi:ribosomal protein S12 methylthiotransferase accessory factor